MPVRESCSALLSGCGRRSPVAGRRSPVAGRRSPVAGRRSPVAGRRSPVAGRRSPVAGRRSPVAGHWSLSCCIDLENGSAPIGQNRKKMTLTIGLVVHAAGNTPPSQSSPVTKTWQATLSTQSSPVTTVCSVYSSVMTAATAIKHMYGVLVIISLMCPFSVIFLFLSPNTE